MTPNANQVTAAMKYQAFRTLKLTPTRIITKGKTKSKTIGITFLTVEDILISIYYHFSIGLYISPLLKMGYLSLT
jgi:hypothetical protein